MKLFQTTPALIVRFLSLWITVLVCIISFFEGDRCRLKKGIVPSVFHFKNPTPSKRKDRCHPRQVDNTSVTDNCDEELQMGIQQEIEIEQSAGTNVDNDIVVDIEDPASHTQGTQCNIPVFTKFSLENFRNDSRIISYYTGFQNYDHVMLLFNCLGPSVNELHASTLLVLFDSDEAAPS